MKSWSANLHINQRLALTYQIWQRYWFLFLIILPLTFGTFYYAFIKFDSPLDAFPIQILCFLIALIWVLFTARFIYQSVVTIKFHLLRIHPAWLLVLSAIILRYFMLTIFPPFNQTGFEEVQTGSNAYRILLHYELPIEFRFTNLLGFIGFNIGSGINLSSLRFPFQITGIFSLILIVFSLRGLKINWISTLFVTFIAATLRFLAIASGVADELFASIPLVAGLLLCIIRIEASDENQPFWAAVAGIFAGMLIFEYTSYHIPVGFALAYLIWKCFSGNKAEKGNKNSSRWLNLLSFLITFTLITIPTVIQTIHDPVNSIFLEAFRRHGGERSTLISVNFLFQIKQYVLGLTGWPAAVSAYYTPVDEPVILQPIGWLFGIALIYSLIFSARSILRGLAITVLITIFSAGMLANDINIGRMAPTIPLFLIMAGAFFDSLYKKITQWVSKITLGNEISLFIPNYFGVEKKEIPEPQMIVFKTIQVKEVSLGSYKQVVINFPGISRLVLKEFISTVFIFLVLGIILSNINSTKRMAKDPQVINEDINDVYSACAYIGSVARQDQQVYIYSPDGYAICTADPVDGWYYDGKQPVIHNVTDQPVSPDVLLPGDLVVFGALNRGLTNEEVSQLFDLGIETNSLTFMQFSKNLAGRITAASICIHCNDQTPIE